MQIVIDIPEEYKNQFDKNRCKEKFDSLATNEFGYILRKAFEAGIPLPKGHGRLIDADKTALLSDLFCYTRYTGIDEAPYEDATTALEFAPTIIEADKAESEG